MYLKIIILLISITIGSSCTQEKPTAPTSIFKNEVNYAFENYHLSYAIKLEKSINSELVETDHRIDLGSGIFPDTYKYNFEIQKTFKRIVEPNYEVEIDYHFTKDSLIKVVMYEWSSARPARRFDDKPYTEEDNKKMRKEIDLKFKELMDMLTDKFGEPTFNAIRYGDDIGKGGTADGVKWLDRNGMNAYLFAFGSSKDGYGRIRLALYPNRRST